MNPARGTLYLVPNTLDLGHDGSPSDLQDVIALGVIRTCELLRRAGIDPLASAAPEAR